MQHVRYAEQGADSSYEVRKNLVNRIELDKWVHFLDRTIIIVIEIFCQYVREISECIVFLVVSFEVWAFQ